VTFACTTPAQTSASAATHTSTSTGTTGTTGTTGSTGTTDALGRCAPLSAPVLGDPGAQILQLVAARSEIPGLRDQPTAHGQILGTLFAFDGRLHLGYGDYNANTGPISMFAWDPKVTDFVDLGDLPTEEILWFRPHRGWLYSPAVDPTAHQGFGGVYRLPCGADEWSEGAPIPGAVHVYDVAAQGDTIYVGTGSLTGEPALLMASEDHGESWTEVHRRESAADEFSRFNYIGATPQQLFVSGSHSYASIREGDGDFTVLAHPPPGLLVPIVLGDAMVIAAFAGDPGRGAHLATYQIEGAKFHTATPWPQSPGEELTLLGWGPGSSDEHLLVLMEASDRSVSVHQTDDLANMEIAWEHLADIPASALPENDHFVSIALLRNDLYLGTRAGSLYALRELKLPLL